MRRIVAVLVLVCAGPAWAAPCVRAVPTSIPCDGVALPVSAAKACARAVVDAAACGETIAACRDGRAIDRREAAGLLKACEDHRRAVVAAQERRIRELERIALTPPDGPAWYESPWLWAGVGAIIGGAAGWHARALVR